MGAPGQRVFFLQAAQRAALVTLKAEKEHVSALGEYLAGLLVRLGAATQAPAAAPGLREPLEPAWAVGSLGVGYEEADDRIVVVAGELVEEEAGTEPATARFHITRSQAAAFAERARAVVRAGRPTCPMCGQPREDPHLCPRRNGQPGHAG